MSNQTWFEKQTGALDFVEERKKALSRFAVKGFPTKETEEYRYTDLTKLADFPFEALSKPPPDGAVQAGEGQIIVWNGTPLLKSARIPARYQVKVGTSKSAKENAESASLGFLNQALNPATLEIEIPKGTSAGMFEIIHVCGENEKTVAAHPRITIRVAAGAKAAIVERFTSLEGLDQSAYFVNTFTDISVGEDATLSYARIENGGKSSWFVGRTAMRLSKGSDVEAFVMGTGAKTQRHEFTVEAAEMSSRTRLFGLNLVESGQHIDQYTMIDHQVPECASEQVFKGIVSEGARSVYHGRVFIRKGAIQTSVKQLNKNLLLGPKSEVDTRPQLEISCDDVKATHGATVGRLSADELFYLQSRGIRPEVAVSMVARGFAEDTAHHFSDVVFKERILREVRDAVANFKAGFAK